jgi:hypothetical protein
MKKPTDSQWRIILYLSAALLWAAALVLLFLVIDFKRFLPHLSAALFVLSLFDAAIAKSKNRSGFAWFLLTLILGPFAALLLFCMKPYQPRQS